MHLVRYCIICVSGAALAQAVAIAGASAGAPRRATPQTRSSPARAETISEKAYYARYYRDRYGFYRYGYDPNKAVLGADVASAPATSVYAYGSVHPTAYAHGEPWSADEPYPYYNYPNASYGYGYGYPIYGGFRHRYWGPAIQEVGGVPERVRGYSEYGEEHWAQPGYRPWGGGFTHRGFDGARYQTVRQRRAAASRR